MGITRVFMPQDTVNAWLATGSAELSAGFLTLIPERRRYRVLESVRIVQEVSGSGDPYQLVGRVKPLDHVRELGAELMGDSMVLDDNAYDIVLGWVALPQAKSAGSGAGLDISGPEPQSEAEALAQFLATNL